MEINRENVFEIINKAGLKADKDYGQNYLIEPSICEKIVNSLNITEDDNVLEIGPGLGSLTNFIKGYKSLSLVDIDNRMINFLKLNYKDPNISFINEDIRKVDVSNFDKIIGNLPYNITTELVIYLLKNAKSCRKMTLMCQAEAYSRFNDLQGEAYGPCSILVHLLGDISKVCLVKAGSFTPVPKCNSIVFNFSFNPICETQDILGTYNLAKSLFISRRKTILNNLKNYLQNSNKSEDILKALDIPFNYRPEQISYKKYLELYNFMKKSNNIFIGK